MSRPSYVARNSAKASAYLKRHVRSRLNGVVEWLRRHPEVKLRAVRILQFIPPLERRLSRLANPGGHGTKIPWLSPVWAIDADPDVLSEWEKIADGAPRIVGARRR